MPLPKGFVKKIRLANRSVGPARRQEMLDNIGVDAPFLPKGIAYEDIDKSFLDSIDKDFTISLNGEKVPVIFLTIQRWGEFSKTWQDSDEYKNIKLPFITVVRHNNIMPGTNQAGNWNEVGIRKYSYLKVPTNEGGRKGIDLYKIPQPTSVDITYEVRLFCNRMRDLNSFNAKVQDLFQSRQHYIYPNEHPMPVHLESIADDSQVDFNKRRFYVQVFEMKLLGYLLSEDEFEIVPTVNRMQINEEIITPDVVTTIKVKKVKATQNITYDFVIKPKSNNRFNFKPEFNINFTSLDMSNLDSIIFKVNGIIKTVPFSVLANDIITVKYQKNFYETSEFTLNGVII